MKLGSEAHIKNEIAAAICDTLNLDGLKHDQAMKITEKCISISEKNGIDFIDKSSPEKMISNKSKERETMQQGEEIKGDRFEERKIKSSTNFLREKQSNTFDFDDDFADECLFIEQNEPSYNQNQMLNQQWNQMMKMRNMRNIQFNMNMQQQGQMMMNIARRKSINSIIKQKSK